MGLYRQGMAIITDEDHLDEPQPEPIALAILRHLRQSGVLDHNDVVAIADALEEDGQEMAAHDVRLTAIDVTPASEFEAEQRRARFRTIDGGNND